MNKMYLFGCMGILAASAILSSCSSSNDDNNGGTTPVTPVTPSTETYNWGKDGDIKTCDHLLFSEEGAENTSGTYIGAFDGTNNWMTGWTNFDPQNTKY